MAPWQWRIQVLKPVTEINANPFVINLKNGLYNVLEETLKPHSPDFCSTVQIQAAYQPEAQCQQFMAFLESTLGAPEIGLMQEILGYFLVPLNKAQKAFILVGAPNAGKSTILSVVQEILLGQDNVSNVAWRWIGRYAAEAAVLRASTLNADYSCFDLYPILVLQSLSGRQFIGIIEFLHVDKNASRLVLNLLELTIPAVCI